MAILSPSILSGDFAYFGQDVQDIAENGGRWVPVCKENGAGVLVAGSAYFNASDRREIIKQIEQ